MGKEAAQRISGWMIQVFQAKITSLHSNQIIILTIDRILLSPKKKMFWCSIKNELDKSFVMVSI
jgi:hypothetical protein